VVALQRFVRDNATLNINVYNNNNNNNNNNTLAVGESRSMNATLTKNDKIVFGCRHVLNFVNMNNLHWR